ncbi:MAG: O-antigen ligase family protein [Arcobacter sp.]|nr:O-antigen ligase family protein [Arcobacter sp.]
MSSYKSYYFLAFFTFIGYYIGLSVLIFFGYIELSRFYTIPLRFLLASIMILLLIFENFRTIKSNREFYYLFWIFWFLYFFAVGREVIKPIPKYQLSPLEIVSYSFIYSIIPFLFFSLRQSDFIINIYKKALIFSGLIFSIISYLMYSKYLLLGIGRISHATYLEKGDFAVLSPLAFSYISSIVIGVCIHELVYKNINKKEKIYLSSTMLIAIIPFLLGASRGSVIALILPLLLVFMIRSQFQKNLKLILIAILFFFLLIYFADTYSSPVFQRSMDLIKGQSSSVGRVFIWETTWNQFITSPILGDSVYCNRPPHPHNIILEVLMSVGILGFVPFSILLFSTIVKGVKIVKYRPEHTWIFIFFMQALSQNMVTGSIRSALWFWASSGLVFSIKINKPLKNIKNWVG